MRIAIIGSHCTGKTTLINLIWRCIDFCDYDFYPEAVREISKLNFQVNEYADDSSQLAMCAIHLLHLKHKDIITDRCLLDNYVYAYMLKERGSDISEKCIDILQHYFLDSINKYDIYAFCPVEFEIKDDGFRMVDKKFQEEVSDEILRTLVKYVPQDKFILLNGETDERIEQLIEFKNAKEKLKCVNNYIHL